MSRWSLRPKHHADLFLLLEKPRQARVSRSGNISFPLHVFTKQRGVQALETGLIQNFTSTIFAENPGTTTGIRSPCLWSEKWTKWSSKFPSLVILI